MDKSIDGKAPAEGKFREGMSFDQWWDARAFEFGYDSIKAAHTAAREAWMACIALAPEPPKEEDNRKDIPVDGLKLVCRCFMYVGPGPLRDAVNWIERILQARTPVAGSEPGAAPGDGEARIAGAARAYVQAESDFHFAGGKLRDQEALDAAWDALCDAVRDVESPQDAGE